MLVDYPLFQQLVFFEKKDYPDHQERILKISG